MTNTATTYEIRSDIPMPEVKPLGRPAELLPLEQFNVGSSILFPVAADSTVDKVLNQVRAKVQRFKKITSSDFKFRVTKYIDPVTDETSVGVWRTA